MDFSLVYCLLNARIAFRLHWRKVNDVYNYAVPNQEFP